jgi:hypothetical protein
MAGVSEHSAMGVGGDVTGGTGATSGNKDIRMVTVAVLRRRESMNRMPVVVDGAVELMPMEQPDPYWRTLHNRKNVVTMHWCAVKTSHVRTVP